jgi:recombination protein RecA
MPKRELSTLEESLIKNINKKFGDDNPMEQLGEDSDRGKIKDYVDTGNLAFNWLISGKLEGGYPVGRITELSGDPSTGKSLFCEMAMTDPSVDLIIYFDTEAAMNIEFLKFLGVDPEKILYMPIDTVEQMQEAANTVLDTVVHNKSNKKVLMVIDSVALATTEKEADPDAGKDMGNKAQLLRSFFRVYARKLEKHNIALLATNHYTQKIGVMYGSNKVTTGGTALPYAASVRLDLKIAETEIDKKLETLGASAVTIKIKTEKNRVFSPKRTVRIVLDFERGVDRFSGLFQILVDLGIAEKNGAWCKLPQWDPEKKFFAKNFPDLVREHDLLPLIQDMMDKAIHRNIEDEIDVEAMNIDEAASGAGDSVSSESEEKTQEEMEEEKKEKKKSKKKKTQQALERATEEES